MIDVARARRASTARRLRLVPAARRRALRRARRCATPGTGIAPAVLDRMFEPFFTTKAVGKGSGMGLAMVHGIVHEHGGHVVVEQPPGEGAEFRVLFEWPTGAGARGAQARRKDAQTAAAPARLAGRVLVVDDEEMIREFIADLLGGWGLEVVACADGVEARDAFAADPQGFDAWLTDQTMPRLTGLRSGEARDAHAPRHPGDPVHGLRRGSEAARAGSGWRAHAGEEADRAAAAASAAGRGITNG